jgi:hypothetical protein
VTSQYRRLARTLARKTNSTSRTKAASAVDEINIGRASLTKASPITFTCVMIHSISFSFTL